MFKKVFTVSLLALTLAVALPAEAKFGSSSSSSSRSFSSSSSYRSSPSFSRPAPTYAAPISRPTGGFSSGGNVGMQRQAVTNTVRNPPPVYAPTYGGGALRQPTYADRRSPISQNTTIVHNNGNIGTPGVGGNGFGMGSMAIAAMGGYMLNGILHDSHGAAYTGPGYSNGMPIPGGQYAPRVEEQPQYQPGQYATPEYAPQRPQVVYESRREDSWPTWVKVILWITGITAVAAIIRRVFF